MQIENLALEVELFKNNLSVKKFMCPAIFVNVVVRQFIAAERGYKITVRDVRPHNLYTKVL